MPRQFTVSQFERNPRHGNNRLCDFNKVIANLKCYTTLTWWAYCVHDKDVYLQADIDQMHELLNHEATKNGIKDEESRAIYIQSHAWRVLNAPKPTHLHIVIKTERSITAEQLSKWLSKDAPFGTYGVPVACIKPVKGHGALLDCTRYLTHEDEKQQQQGKHLYDDSEIFTSDSFSDWREQLDKQKEDDEIYGAGRTQAQKFILDVQAGRKTLRECFAEMDGIDYAKNLSTLQKMRGEFLTKKAVPPNTRINFYVEGSGGDW